MMSCRLLKAAAGLACLWPMLVGGAPALAGEAGAEAIPGKTWLWPVGSSHDRSRLSQDYADYNDSYFGGSHYKYHTGFDIAEPKGTPIIAAANGWVAAMVRNVSGCSSCVDHGDGNTLVIKHGGKVFAQYQHLDSFDSSLDAQVVGACSTSDNARYSCPAKAVRVSAGQRIGYVGGTGFGQSAYYGYHLHFEVKTCSAISQCAGGAPEYGYTVEFPFDVGYLDPSKYVDGPVGSMSTTHVTVVTTGLHMRLGPNADYPSGYSPSSGEAFYAWKTAPATTSCSMGWYRVSKGSDYPGNPVNFFSSPVAGSTEHLPDLWVCRGDNGETYVSP